MRTQSQNPAGELYVHRIDELREEIRHAMAAISGNQLQTLEESLWRQEMLCTGLQQLLGPVQSLDPDAALRARLHTSLTALQHVKQSYAELLRQAQASNHVLYALCRGHGAMPAHPAGIADPRRSFEA